MLGNGFVDSSVVFTTFSRSTATCRHRGKYLSRLAALSDVADYAELTGALAEVFSEQRLRLAFVQSRSSAPEQAR